MKISMYTGGFVQTNGYLIETAHGNLLIDAPEGITAWAKDRGVRVDEVLLTHQHYDHVMDAAALQAGGSRLHALEDYSTELTLEAPAKAWGLPISVVPYRTDLKFPRSAGGTGMEDLLLCGLTLRMAHVPGHSLDSVTFYLEEAGLLFSGDTLFAGSIGRTDLPGGSTGQLLEGIARHLLVLPAETKVFPGHGSSTTIGEEKRGNPFLR